MQDITRMLVNLPTAGVLYEIHLFSVFDHLIIIRNGDPFFLLYEAYIWFLFRLLYIRVLPNARRELSMSNRPCWHRLTVMFSMFYRLQRFLTLYDGCAGILLSECINALPIQLRFVQQTQESEHGIPISSDMDASSLSRMILIPQVSFWIIHLMVESCLFCLSTVVHRMSRIKNLYLPFRLTLYVFTVDLDLMYFN